MQSLLALDSSPGPLECRYGTSYFIVLQEQPMANYFKRTRGAKLPSMGHKESSFTACAEALKVYSAQGLAVLSRG